MKWGNEARAIKVPRMKSNQVKLVLLTLFFRALLWNIPEGNVSVCRDYVSGKMEW